MTTAASQKQGSTHPPPNLLAAGLAPRTPAFCTAIQPSTCLSEKRDSRRSAQSTGSTPKGRDTGVTGIMPSRSALAPHHCATGSPARAETWAVRTRHRPGTHAAGGKEWRALRVSGNFPCCGCGLWKEESGTLPKLCSSLPLCYFPDTRTDISCLLT